jgi:large subunit ribosomal protein L20
MPRALDLPARRDRKKKILKEAKGYFGRRKNIYRTAKDAVEKGWEHAYRDRKKKKRNFRSLWITGSTRPRGSTTSPTPASWTG